MAEENQPLLRPEEIKDSSQPPLPPPDPGLKEEFERLRKLQSQIEAERKEKLGREGKAPQIENISLPPSSPPAAPVSQPLAAPEEKRGGGNIGESQGEEESGKSKWGLVMVGILVLGIVVGGGYFYLRNRNSTQTSEIPPLASPETPAATTSVQQRDSQRKGDLKNIQAALEKYFAASGSYPISATFDKLNTPASTVKQALVPTYLSTMPLDPNDPSNYYGYKSTEGITYQLTSILEDKTDPEGQMLSGVFLYVLSPEPATTSGSSSSSTGLPIQ